MSRQKRSDEERIRRNKLLLKVNTVLEAKISDLFCNKLLTSAESYRQKKVCLEVAAAAARFSNVTVV
jgi:hypothetical protein